RNCPRHECAPYSNCTTVDGGGNPSAASNCSIAGSAPRSENSVIGSPPIDSEANAERDREVTRVGRRGRRGGASGQLRPDGHLRAPHIVIPRLDVELHLLAEGHTAAEVDAEVVRRTVADDVINGHGRRITDIPERIAERRVADGGRGDLDDAVIEPAA